MTRDPQPANGAQVVQHAFENMAPSAIGQSTCGFAISLAITLDADERLTPKLIASIRSLPENTAHSGFFIARLVQFSWAATAAWRHVTDVALAALPQARAVARSADTTSIFYLSGVRPTASKGYMIDDIRMPLSDGQ